MKTELNLGRRLKGLLCVTLSMVMFFGMTLGVQAAGTTYYLECDSSSNYFSYSKNAADPVSSSEIIHADDVIDVYGTGGVAVVCINGVEKTRTNGLFTVPHDSQNYTFALLGNTNDSTYTLNLLYNVSASTDQNHTHSYTWQTVKEVTETQDGEEAYICDCGDVAERKIISACGFYWNEMIKKIKEAKAGDSLVFTSDIWNSFPKRVIDALAERRDITVEIQFPYQTKKWKVVIPTKAEIDTTCEWYGPEKLTQMFGRTEIVK